MLKWSEGDEGTKNPMKIPNKIPNEGNISSKLFGGNNHFLWDSKDEMFLER